MVAKNLPLLKNKRTIVCLLYLTTLFDHWHHQHLNKPCQELDTVGPKKPQLSPKLPPNSGKQKLNKAKCRKMDNICRNYLGFFMSKSPSKASYSTIYPKDTYKRAKMGQILCTSAAKSPKPLLCWF